MRSKRIMAVIFVFVLFLSWIVSADTKKEECPKTGTYLDSLIKEAYDCKAKFDTAGVSKDNGIKVLKELYATTFGKEEKEKEEIMALIDTAFISMLEDEEIRKNFKEKLSEDGEATVDTLKMQMDDALLRLRDANDDAVKLEKKIPAAIKELPSKFKGMNAMKIPKVKAALEKAKGWVDNVVANTPPQVTMVKSIVEIAVYFLAEEE